MLKFQTPIIPLTAGISDRPLLSAPIGAVKDVENMLITDRGLIRRPGIKHVEDFDVLNGDQTSTFLNAHTINIEGEDCIAYFYYDATSTQLKVRVKSMEQNGTIDLVLNIKLTIQDPTKDVPTKGKLLYLGSSQFVVLTDKAYIKATWADENDTILPPMQWLVIETKDGQPFNSVGVKDDSIQVNFALLGTPYVLSFRYMLAANETIQDVINALKLFIDFFPAIIDGALHNHTSAWTYYTLSSSGNEYSFTIKNGRVDPTKDVTPVPMGDAPVYQAWDTTNGQLLLYDALSDITYIFDSVSMEWYTTLTEPNTIRLAFSPTYTIQYPDGTTATGESILDIPNVKGIEIKDVLYNDSSSQLLVVHESVATNEVLPKAVKGFTIEVSSLEGYPKTYVATTSGVYREETFYVTKSLVLRTDNVGTPIWDITIEYGLKQLEFFQYTTLVVESFEGTYFYQDDYVVLINIPTNVAKYVIPPTIVDNYIKDALIFQGRVGLLAHNGVTFTSFKNPYQIVVLRPDMVVDTDPIDIGLEGGAFALHPYEEYLLILAHHKQYLLAWEGYFSPKTVSLTTISAYDLAEVMPVTLNNSVIFIDENNRFLELFVTNQKSVPKPFYVTEYTILDNITELVASPTLSMLFAKTQTNIVYTLYAPPIENLEKLYRPLSKQTFVKGTLIGEINGLLYFINPVTLDGVRYIQIGTLDLTLIRKTFSNQLSNNAFLSIDWYQVTDQITASCTNDGQVQYTATFNLAALDPAQYRVWKEYPDSINVLELVDAQLATITLTSNPATTQVQATDSNFNCLANGASYTLDPATLNDLAVKLYIGIPFVSQVKFAVQPVYQEQTLMSNKYNVVELKLYTYGGGFQVKYFRDILIPTPYMVYNHHGQELNYVEVNKMAYDAEIVYIRTPLPYKAFVQITNLTEEPLIIYGYQARITYYERR